MNKYLIGIAIKTGIMFHVKHNSCQTVDKLGVGDYAQHQVCLQSE